MNRIRLIDRLEIDEEEDNIEQIASEDHQEEIIIEDHGETVIVEDHSEEIEAKQEGQETVQSQTDKQDPLLMITTENWTHNSYDDNPELKTTIKVCTKICCSRTL